MSSTDLTIVRTAPLFAFGFRVSFGIRHLEFVIVREGQVPVESGFELSILVHRRQDNRRGPANRS